MRPAATSERFGFEAPLEPNGANARESLYARVKAMTLRFSITGMSCAACAERIEKATSAIKGVAAVKVDLSSAVMEVTAESSDTKMPVAEEIIFAVTAAGYGIKLSETGNGGCGRECAMQTDFDITGMSCSACAAHIEKAVSKIKGVGKVSVNLLTNSMRAEYDADATSANAIKAAVEKAGYGARERTGSDKPAVSAANGSAAAKRAEAQRDMRIRLIVSLVFMAALMYVAMGHMWGAPLPAFLMGAGNAVSYAFTQLLLTLPILYFNRAYYINGFKSLFRGAPNMDTLVATGSAASLVYGVYAIYKMSSALGIGDTASVEELMHDLYFESAGMILALVTVGKYLESKSKLKTGDALAKLKKLAPLGALLMVNGAETEIDSAALKPGDEIAVKSGMSVPADATVISGSAFADESAISGESVPVEKREGDKLIGGTVLKSGYLRARVSAVGGESVLQRIITLVENAGAAKAPIARVADKVAGVFVPIVMCIALATFIGWAAGTKDVDTAIQTSIAVLVISCPCALGLATPVAIMVGTGKGAENGILIKSGEALERLHSVKYVVLDKTGTITSGMPRVVTVSVSEEVLQAVYSLEKKSEHPLGEAVVRYGEEKGIAELTTEGFATLPGRGVTGTVGGKEYAVGNALLMRERGVKEEEFSEELRRVGEEGSTPLLIECDGKYMGLIAAADTVKETSAEAVMRLKRMGIGTVMLTGDNARTANAVARIAGVDEVIAEVLPEDKERVVAKLSRLGGVAMVGDGINDAPALMRADVGIAIGSGADIAVDSADIILVKNDLMDVVNAFRLSARTMRNIKENLFWAFFYNALGIPLAAGALFVPFGIRLNPMIGALAMSLSSLFVVGNALRLKFFKPLRHENAHVKTDDGKIPEEKGSCKSAAHTEKTETLPIRRENNMQTELKIEGMMCKHCAARVESALKGVAGVGSVSVSLENKLALVEGGDAEALKQAVTEAGYEVTGVKKL